MDEKINYEDLIFLTLIFRVYNLELLTKIDILAWKVLK